jgi:hypothetical protein
LALRQLRVPKCCRFGKVAILATPVAMLSCRNQDLYVHNKTNNSITVEVTGQTVVRAPPNAYQMVPISIRGDTMTVEVEILGRKRSMRCPCPAGTDVLEVIVDTGGRISCGGT